MASISAFKTEAKRKQVLDIYDNIINSWPVSYTEHNITTSFGNTFILASGTNEKEPLILLHGGASNSSMWIYNIEQLSKSFKVYAIDIIGEAGKSDNSRPSYKSKKHAEWLNEILNKLDVNKVSICGVSLGAMLANHFALTYPEKVDKLILHAPPNLVKMKVGFIIRSISANLLPFRYFAETFLKYICNRYDKFSASEISAFITQFTSYKFDFLNPIPLLSDHELSTLPENTLLLFGDGEVVYDLKVALKRVNTLNKNIRVKVIKQAKHALYADQPELFNKAIINFMVH